MAKIRTSIKRKCKYCSKPFYVFLSRADRIKFCSAECRRLGCINPICKRGHNKDIVGRTKYGQCRLCRNESQKKHQETQQAKDYYKNYTKFVVNGWILKTYRAMNRRISGKHDKANSYIGLPICTYKEFKDWVLLPENVAILQNLIEIYKQSGLRNDCPTVEKIFHNDGYVIGNMEILSLRDNLKRREWLIFKAK